LKTNKYLTLTIITMITVILIMCDHEVKQLSPIIGIETIYPDQSSYTKIFYVSDADDQDEPGNGTIKNPWTSINYALDQISDASDAQRYAIFISAGTYSKNTLNLKSHIDLFGGYDANDWQRDVEKNKTILNGDEKRRVVVGADDCRLDGFVITEGVVRGAGAAILCAGVKMTISNNTFTKNKTIGPENWKPKYWHETANDGGAIYCTNNAEVKIENNHFVSNFTDNGRGAGIGADHYCALQIKNNVFYGNKAGLNDPMRSSDGGAVSIFRWSKAEIENNLILSNKALAHNDAGGIFVALWSSANIKNNIFVDNEAGDDAGGLFVGGQEHRYDGPLDPIPPADSFFVSIDGNTFIGNRNSSSNSGAMRFTMESRGKFSNNVVAQNNGIYFQRSEVEISNNIILDDMLFVETKEGLKPGVIRDNIIWADFNLETEARVENNNFKNKDISESNYHKSFSFKDDMIRLKIASAVSKPREVYSIMTIIGDQMKPGIYRNRVVKVGQKWSAIRDNDANSLWLWGKFTGTTELTILPTYTVKN
jgi:hypothetical protein